MPRAGEQQTSDEWANPNAFPIASLMTYEGFRRFNVPENLGHIAATMGVELGPDANARAQEILDGFWEDDRTLKEYGNRIIDAAYEHNEMMNAVSRDGLTGLLNQTAWRHVLRNSVRRAEETGGSVAVVLLDLDAFKEANETLTHQVADDILVEVADVLLNFVRRGKILSGRLGGDEFGIILEFPPGTGQSETRDQDAAPRKARGKGKAPTQRDAEPERGAEREMELPERVDRAVERVMDELVVVLNEKLSSRGIARLRVSAGAAIFQTGKSPTVNMEDLLYAADKNVKAAKEAGRMAHLKGFSRDRLEKYAKGWALIRESGVFWVDERMLPKVTISRDDEAND